MTGYEEGGREKMYKYEIKRVGCHGDALNNKTDIKGFKTLSC